MAEAQPPPVTEPPVPPVSVARPPPAPTPASASRRPPAKTAPAPGAGALQEETLMTFLARMDRKAQALLDSVAPYKLERWLGLVALLAIFVTRMVLLQGFYIITYVLFIFILNQFILFLQPKDRATLVARASQPADTEESAPLPTTDGEEFRPFVRRLPEFKFWISTTCATVLAIFATFFKMFDVPVFWPVLLIYFVLLFVTTMRRQWLDMKKLKYVPWDIGTKKVYKSDPKRVSVTRPMVKPDVVAMSGRAPTAPVPTVNIATKKPTVPKPGSAPSTAPPSSTRQPAQN